jgi:hypothetical protein
MILCVYIKRYACAVYAYVRVYILHSIMYKLLQYVYHI